MKKKILIIGNDAKGYALAQKLAEKHEIFITPSSDTLKEFATCLDIREENSTELLEFAMENGIDLTIPTSVAALKTDIVEKFSANNQQIFAPSINAAKIVFDKALAKKVLYKLRIPTPKFGIFEKQNMVLDYLKNQKIPFVLKNDDSNSAAIFTSLQTAKKLVDASFIEKNKRIIIEDYIYGTPFSFYAITDGYKALPIGSSLTYKHSLEGNGGQLTAGMGACAPNYKLSIENEYFLMDNVIYPTLDYLEIEGNPYLGILGVNGILADDGRIFVLGWQGFMQNCDAVAILENLDEDLYSLLESCVIGSFSDEVENITTKDQYAVSLVLKNKNRENVENAIQGLDLLDDNTRKAFFPTVTKNRYLELESQFGATLSLTSSAPTVARAVEKVYSEADSIKFNGISYRKDICGYKI